MAFLGSDWLLDVEVVGNGTFSVDQMLQECLGSSCQAAHAHLYLFLQLVLVCYYGRKIVEHGKIGKLKFMKWAERAEIEQGCWAVPIK